MPGFALDLLVTLPDRDFTSIYLISLSLLFPHFFGLCWCQDWPGALPPLTEVIFGSVEREEGKSNWTG